MNQHDTQSATAELHEILDEQARLLEDKCSQLAELAAALVRRDDDATERLLGQMERTEQEQANADLALETARRSLAESHELPAAGMSLSRLAEALGDREGALLRMKRQRLADLIAQLRREQLQVSILLNECMRVNQMMLDVFAPSQQSVVTYGTNGADRWRTGSGLVDTEI